MEMDIISTVATVASMGFAKGFIEGAMANGLTFDMAVEAARAFLISAAADLDDYVEKKKSE